MSTNRIFPKEVYQPCDGKSLSSGEVVDIEIADLMLNR